VRWNPHDYKSLRCHRIPFGRNPIDEDCKRRVSQERGNTGTNRSPARHIPQDAGGAAEAAQSVRTDVCPRQSLGVVCRPANDFDLRATPGALAVSAYA
jgi:hypothetical protein